MVERLTVGPASVSELAEPLAMSLAAVVQHVQVLEACGVVKTEKVGRTRMCRIEPAAMTAAEQWITDRRRGWEARLDRLGDLLHNPAITEEETMSLSTVAHETFVIERTYDVPVAQTFQAWADPVLKARWFAGSAEALGPATPDFRVGGREINRGGPPGGPVYTYESEFRDIVPEQRSSTRTSAADVVRISVSVATVLFSGPMQSQLVLTDRGCSSTATTRWLSGKREPVPCWTRSPPA